MRDDRRVLGGLLIKKVCWTLSIQGKLLALLVGVLAALVMARSLHAFLAVTSRKSAEIVVVEGWIRADSIEQAASECLATPRQAVLIVRPITTSSNKWESGFCFVEYIQSQLIKLGVPGDRVHIVGGEVLKKDRTYHSALAVRLWLKEHNLAPKSIDVLTPDTHARRSRILFEKAFGDELTVGVIALNERTYDPVHWWRSSEGVREVLFEAVAYLYARFCFHPPTPLP